MGALTKAAAGKELAAAKQPMTLAEVIKREWPKIEAVMPKHLSSERLYQLTLSAINHEPKLGQCEISTLLSCVMKCSALGLEPSAVDGLGRAYILPYKNGKRNTMEATFILGYKGMIDLARRSGQIESIAARAVYEGDIFEYEFGLNETCRHIPRPIERTPDKLTHVYMVARFKDGGYYMDVMTKAEVEAIRKRSKAGTSGPWVTDYEAMAKKTVLRRAFPYLPVSIEAQTAAASDETSGGYEGTLGGPEPIIEAEVEEVPTETETAPQDEPQQASEGFMAYCCECGNVVEGLSAGADLQQLAATGCCASPVYAWA